MAALLSFQTVIILTRIPIFTGTHLRINELKCRGGLARLGEELSFKSSS